MIAEGNDNDGLNGSCIISENANGAANPLVASKTGYRIRVTSFNMISAGTVTAKFVEDGAGTPADLTGPYAMVANSGLSAAYHPKGYFETSIGKSLDMSLSVGSVLVGGVLTYEYI